MIGNTEHSALGTRHTDSLLEGNSFLAGQRFHGHSLTMFVLEAWEKGSMALTKYCEPLSFGGGGR